MGYFGVSPSEALLVGLSFGEYFVHCRSEPESKERFLGFLQRRLSPFVPYMRERRVGIRKEDIPADIELRGDEGDSVRLGLSQTDPDALYFYHYVIDLTEIDAPGYTYAVTRVTWDSGRRSLLDLLNDYLGESVGRSLMDTMKFGPDAPTRALDFPRAVLESERARADSDWDKLAEYEKRADREDSESDIAKRLRALVDHSGCGEYYWLGKMFGFALGVCGQCEAEARQFDQQNVPEYFMEEVFEESWGPNEALRDALTKLLADRLVANCFHAAEMLRNVPKLDPGKLFSRDRLEGRLIIENMNEARAAIWLAVGEVLGTLHQSDEEARNKDSSLPVPRTWVDFFDATGDKTRAFLKTAEKDLNERAGEPFLAERIVALLKESVEGVARGTFEGPFAPRGSGGIWDYLREKSRFGNPIEKRFSEIALTLNRTYRVPASHDFTEFTCTLEEARFFVVGIRTLLTLSEEIRKGGRGKNG